MMTDNNSDAEIAPGDVVGLKSGGPPMTVLHRIGHAAEVAWFTSSDLSDDDLVTRIFPVACLDLIVVDDDGTDDDGERNPITGEVIEFGQRAANSDAQAVGREVAA